MEFKYFKDFERFTTLSEGEVECEICNQESVCFDPVFLGDEDVEFICPKCLFEKKLYGRNIFTNSGNFEELQSQISEAYPELSQEQQIELAKDRDRELEQATPQLITWQDFQWPCIDGDYGKFIGYGSKAFFNSLSTDADGKSLFKESLHPDLKEYYTEQQWIEMVPDNIINDYKESNEYSMLFYVFKSLTSDRLII